MVTVHLWAHSSPCTILVQNMHHDLYHINARTWVWFKRHVVCDRNRSTCSWQRGEDQFSTYICLRVMRYAQWFISVDVIVNCSFIYWAWFLALKSFLFDIDRDTETDGKFWTVELRKILFYFKTYVNKVSHLKDYPCLRLLDFYYAKIEINILSTNTWFTQTTLRHYWNNHLKSALSTCTLL